MSTRRTTSRSVSLVAVLGLLLTACGSNDSDTDTGSEPAATASRTPSGGPGGGPGGFDQEQLDALQKCLEAAGLGDAFPTDLPSGQPSDFPSDRPSDFPSDVPSDLPSDFPSGGSGGGPGGGALGALNDPEVQAALQACGIELPTGRPSPEASS